MTDRGVTLIEVLVVLVIIGIAVGLTGVAAGIVRDAPDTFPLDVARARERAARIGHPVQLPTDSTILTLLPDGSAMPNRVVVQGTRWRVDPWTAEATREAP